MDNIKEQIYLGALLHDIGKFYQRADRPLSDKQNELSPYSKRLADDICKVYPSGGFGYQHTIWANQFLDDIADTLTKVPGIRQNIYENPDLEDSLINFACNHHRPRTLLQGIVTLADWWSAGIDRSNTESLETEHGKKGNYKSIPLYSIFNEITNNATGEPAGCSSFLLNELSINRDKLFPVDNAEKRNSEESYRKLWNGFISEFRELPTGSFKSFSETLLFMLKKYTWSIPSNTNDMADVSLYEHLKTTAAIAHSLFCYYEENPDAFLWDGSSGRLKIQDDHHPVLMLGGDISGIQKFIYNITSAKAAVSLKGRSFYLQLLTDAAIQRILSHKDIDATLGQVVYSSGGKFYMLLPNTKKVRAAIEELQQDFEQTLWKELHGQIALNIETVAFSYNTEHSQPSESRISFQDGSAGSIGQLWKALADRLTKAKTHKFSSIIKNDFDSMFRPQNVSADTRVCAITGIESEQCINMQDKEDPLFILPYVKDQIDLGRTLKDADYIITHTENGEHNFIANKASCSIEILGIHSYLFDKAELADNNAEFRGISSADTCMVKAINNPDNQGEVNFLKAPVKGNGTSYGFQFYGGNKQALTRRHDPSDPKNKKYIAKTFEELAGKDKGGLLGILRMDVDGLGSIFIKGLPEGRRSFAAYSTLSFLLDTFFSGYLNTIRDKDEYREDVNILYSGGDDIFAIGRWDKIILFAEDVRKGFRDFTGRDDISISGGIVMVKPKFPISKAAEMAGDAEDAAKRFSRHPGAPAEKNAITIFGEAISWNKEFDIVKQWKDRLISCLDQEDGNGGDMSKAILHRVMTLYEMSRANDKQTADKSWLWRGTYSLTRAKAGKSKNTADLCDDIIRLLYEKNSTDLKLIAIAARWAELESRQTFNE